MSTIQEELREAIEQIGENFDAFGKSVKSELAQHRDHREELERKLNALRIGSLSGDQGAENPADVFTRSLKAWNPQRAIESFDYGDYRKSFSKYIRSGLESLSMDERKAMQVGVDSDGGFLVPTELARIIIKIERDNSVIRSIAREIPAGAGEIEFPASLTRPAVGWVGETGSRTATATPNLAKLMFNAKELYAMPEVTQKLIDDSAFNIEAFIGEEIGLAIAEEEDDKFIAGDGVLTPRGFTTYATAATADSAGTRPFDTIEHIATGVAGNWPATDSALYDKLVDVTHALRPAYRRRAEWVMPTAAIARLRKMKDGQGNPIWQPSMAAGQPDRLLGYAVNEAEQMPAVAANSLSVAFADWQRAYWILDRFGVRVLRDPYTNKPYIRFYTTKRLTGGVADTCAIKLLKFSTT